MKREKVGSLDHELLLLQLEMRNMRARYIKNVQTGKTKHDPIALAYFDSQLEAANGRAKSLSAKR
jgi:hypothetical protein